MPSLNRQLMNLKEERNNHLAAAEVAITGGDKAAYDTAMTMALDMNPKMKDIQNLMDEQARDFRESPGGQREAQDRMAEQAEMLRKGHEITLATEDVRLELMRDVRNMTTLASDDLIRPTRTGTNIRDSFGPVNSILDQVTVEDLTGTGGIKEPYAVTELEGKKSKVETSAGTARPDSTPGFRSAAINPYEVTVTSYVDRNITRLTNVGYTQRIVGMALTALRKSATELIYAGDGEASPVMFGFQNATNTKGEAMYQTMTIDEIDIDTLLDLDLAFLSDEELGEGRLYLPKANLQLITKLRDLNDRRLYKHRRDPSNRNNGIILEDDSDFLPFTLTSRYAAIAGAADGAKLMGYGTPSAYKLGLFGGYTVRVSDDHKAPERMLTILGDVMLGGNLVVDGAFINVVKGAPTP